MRLEHARNMIGTAALASRREGDLAETVAVTVVPLEYSRSIPGVQHWED